MSKINVLKTIKKYRIADKSPANDEIVNKEVKWNNRFHLAKVPKYDAFNDKNYLSIVKLKQELKIHPELVRQKLKDEDNIRSKSKSASKINRALKSSEEQRKAEERREKFLESHSDEISIIKNMWEDLGVSEPFKNIFLNISFDLEVNNCKEFLNYEINSLTKLASNLNKLSKEVEAREKTIALIEQFCEVLKSNDLNDKLLNDIVQVFKNIRVLSINIINYFNKVREASSYYIMGGKFNLDNLSSGFNYDRNYLIKMKNDTDFLRNSLLGKYFNFYHDSDPFLISIAEKYEKEDEEEIEKIVVPINEEITKYIKNGQFTILQDLIIYELNNINNSIPFHKTNLSKDIFSSISFQSGSKIERPKSLYHSQRVKGAIQTKGGSKIEINIRNKFPLQDAKLKGLYKDDSTSPFKKIRVNERDEYINMKTSDSNSRDRINRSNEKERKGKADNSDYFADMIIKESGKVEKEIERLEKKKDKKVKVDDNKNKIDKIKIEIKDEVDEQKKIYNIQSNLKNNNNLDENYNDNFDNNYNDDEDLKIIANNIDHNQNHSNKESLGNTLKKSSVKDLIGLHTINENIESNQNNSLANNNQNINENYNSNYNSDHLDKSKQQSKILYEDNFDNIAEEEIPVENNYIDTGNSKSKFKDESHINHINNNVKSNQKERPISPNNDHKKSKMLDNSINSKIIFENSPEKTDKDKDLMEKSVFKTEVEAEIKNKISDFITDLFKTSYQKESENNKIQKEILDYVANEEYMKDTYKNSNKGLDKSVNNSLDKSINEDFAKTNKKLSIFVGELVNENQRIKTLNTNTNKSIIKGNNNITHNTIEDEKHIRENITNFVDELMRKNQICTPKYTEEKSKRFSKFHKDEEKFQHINTSKKNVNNNTNNSINNSKNNLVNISKGEIKKDTSTPKKNVNNNTNNSINLTPKKRNETKNAPDKKSSLNTSKIKTENKEEIPLAKKSVKIKESSNKSIQQEKQDKTINNSEIDKHLNISKDSANISSIAGNKKDSSFEINKKEDSSLLIKDEKSKYFAQTEIDHEEANNSEEDKDSKANVVFELNKEEQNIEHPHDTTSDKDRKISFYKDEYELEEFEQYYQFYIKKVSEDQKVSFDIKTDIHEYFNNTINPKIITIEEKQTTIGIAIVGYENTTDNIINLVVKHFSVLKFEDYEINFKEVLEFIKENIVCDQILVNLHYDNVKNELSPELKNYFKNIFHFRLKKVENLFGGRIAKFVLTINDAINLVEFMYQPTTNAMNYKISTIIGVCESLKLVEASGDSEIVVDKGVNFFNVMLIICEMLNEHNNYTCNLELFQRESIKEMNSLCTKFLNLNLNDKSKLIRKFSEDNQIKELITKFSDNLSILNADVEMSLKFRTVFTNYLKINEVDVLYYRITEKIKVYKNNTNDLFYSIPTCDSNLTFIISEATKKDETKTLYEEFYSTYPTLELVEEAEKKIWIPGFKRINNEFYSNVNFLKDLNNLILTKNEVEYKLSQLLECSNFEFVYGDDCHHSFKLEEDEKEIKINKDFQCAIVHNEILGQVKIPAIFVTHVSFNDFITK